MRQNIKSKNMFKDYDVSIKGKYLNINDSFKNKNNYDTSQKHNSFKTTHNLGNDIVTKKTTTENQFIDINNNELFPELIPTTHKDNITPNSTFKEVLRTNNTKTNDDLKDNLDDGQVAIFIDNTGNTVYKYGNPTSYTIKQQLQNELKKSTNYIMEKIIIELDKNMEKYINIYDSIHGEGAYYEKYESIIKQCQEYNDDSDSDDSYSYDSEQTND